MGKRKTADYQVLESDGSICWYFDGESYSFDIIRLSEKEVELLWPLAFRDRHNALNLLRS